MQTAVRITAGLVVVAGVVNLILAPLLGSSVSADLWGVEPLAYVGAMLVIAGLVIVTLSYLISDVRRRNGASDPADGSTRWDQVTEQYFELFDHDLGRPLRRILGKERESRAVLTSSGETIDPAVMELLDEIERQTPTFRLMMSNIRVLVQMEAPDTAPRFEPVEPSEVVRKIVDRYTSVAAESERELTWWAEPVEFGMVYSDGSAVEHIVTNLVDNAVRFASEHIEVKITKNPTHFFVRVLGRRPGNRPPLCSAYLRSRLDAGSGEEGGEVQLRPGALFIARTLANGCGGDLAVESVETPDPQHHTAFLMSLPLGEVTRS